MQTTTNGSGAAFASPASSITASASFAATISAFHPPPFFPIPIVTADDVQQGVANPLGCRYLRATNQLIFVEFNSGRIGILDLIAPTVSVTSGNATIPAGATFDCDTGTIGGVADLWWESSGTTHRVHPRGAARLTPLGSSDYAAVTSGSLQSFPYTDEPIDATTAPIVIGVHTNGKRYSKLQITLAGADLHVAWTTFQLGPRVHYPGTGFDVLDDILVEPDGIHAYVTERDGDLLRVDLSSNVPGGNGTIAGGLNAPHQMQFSGDGNSIYLVEYAANGRLLRIDKTTGAQHVITAHLDHAVGLVISDGDQYAYVSEQPTGADGRVRRVELSTGAIADVATGFNAPFMMAWQDDSKQRIVLCEGTFADRLATIDLSNGNAVARPVTGLDFGPACPAAIGDGRIYVTCQSAIDEVSIGGSVFTGEFWKGIGSVPIERIVPAVGPWPPAPPPPGPPPPVVPLQNVGRADTSIDANTPFYVKNAPFGGTLSMRINHYRAWLAGARWYRFVLNGTPVADPYYAYKRTPALTVVQTVPVTMTLHAPSGTAPGQVLPVHDVATFDSWDMPDFGGTVDSTDKAKVPHDGVSTLEVQFFDAAGSIVHYSAGGAHPIYFNNSPCFAKVSMPALNNATFATDECGVLYYNSLTTDSVTLGFEVAHVNTDPNPFTRQDDATFSWGVQRGIYGLPVSVAAAPGHALPASPSQQNVPLTTLLRKITAPTQFCTLAGFVEELGVYTTAIDGVYRCSGYDAGSQVAFCLAPSTP